MDNLRTPLTLPRKKLSENTVSGFPAWGVFYFSKKLASSGFRYKICFYVFSLQYIADVIKKLASKKYAVV